MTELETSQAPAAAGSMLAGLRDRRKRAEEALHLDLAVPRLDPPVYVRFRAVKQREIDIANTHAAKSKDADKYVTANAVVLTHTCLGVFEIVDGKERSIDPNGTEDPATWPRFDDRLAELLELPEGTKASEVARGLYLTDGDVIAVASELTRWSGFAIQELERETEGN